MKYRTQINVSLKKLLTGIARPFRFNVDFDDFEDTVTAKNDASDNDILLAPGGIIGFSLDYTQLAC